MVIVMNDDDDNDMSTTVNYFMEIHESLPEVQALNCSA